MWERACSRRRCISNNQAASPTAIAGKPAPTLMSGRPKSPHPPQSKCGSGLAREGGVSVTTRPPDPPPSQASQLPPLWVTDQNLRTHRNPIVGAGLARDGTPSASHPPLDAPHYQAPARPHFSGLVPIYGMQIYILRYFKRWVYSRLHQHSLPKIKQVKRCSPNRCHYPPCRNPPTVSG